MIARRIAFLSDLVCAPNAPNRSGRDRENRHSKFYEISDNLQEVGDDERVDPELRPLLDHIAAELAQEYIRLMEAAAAAQSTAGSSAVSA